MHPAGCRGRPQTDNERSILALGHLPESDAEASPMNSILVIRPYKYEGLWSSTMHAWGWRKSRLLLGPIPSSIGWWSMSRMPRRGSPSCSRPPLSRAANTSSCGGERSSAATGTSAPSSTWRVGSAPHSSSISRPHPSRSSPRSNPRVVDGPPGPRTWPYAPSPPW